MQETRRDLMKLSGMFALLASTGLLTAEQALAQQQGWNKASFEAKNLSDTVKALGGSGVAESKDITINAPEIAENGAVVQVGVTSKLPNTQAVYILVDKNPNWLAAGFKFPDGTPADVTTRIKMGQTSNVLALVKANDKFFVNSKEVKVTLGGCGG